jgi:hypothetical protein
MGVNVDGDGFAQHLERGVGGFGRLRGSSRAARLNAAGKHGTERCQCRTPHPLAARERVAMATAIHVAFPSKRFGALSGGG